MRTVRRKCTDHVLIYGRRHLERVLGAYVAQDVAERPSDDASSWRSASRAGVRYPNSPFSPSWDASMAALEDLERQLAQLRERTRASR